MINNLTQPAELEIIPDAPASVPKVPLGYLDSLRVLAAIQAVMAHAMDQVDRNGLYSSY